MRLPGLCVFLLFLLFLLSGCDRSVPEPHVVSTNLPRLRELDFAPFETALEKASQRRLRKVEGFLQAATIPEVQAAFARGEFTSEELTLYFLDRIRRHDESLRSYLELNPRALDEARESDRLRAAGQTKGPLSGIPLSVKDNIATAGPMHTTAGAEILLDHVADSDARLVVRLREAGAVILGKASLSELAGSLTTDPPGYNAVGGMGVNPYRSDLPVSGSSSGSAVATSALLAMASVGTETSGSLLSPGASNGVVAMKPSHGVVSGEGIVPLIRFQDSAGPIARTVTDAAILLHAMGESTAKGTLHLDDGALEGVAVGVLRKAILEEEPDAGFWLARVDKGLSRTGAKIRNLDETFAEKPDLLPLIFLGLSRDTMPYLHGAGAPVETVDELRTYHLENPQRRIPRGQNLIDLAVKVLAAIRAETGLREEELDPVYEEAGVALQEEMSVLLAKTFEEGEVDVLVSLANLHSPLYATAGYPAITIPLGLDEGAAPNGVTFIARPGEDDMLLKAAFAFEQATRLRIRPDLD